MSNHIGVMEMGIKTQIRAVIARPEPPLAAIRHRKTGAQGRRDACDT